MSGIDEAHCRIIVEHSDGLISEFTELCCDGTYLRPLTAHNEHPLVGRFDPQCETPQRHNQPSDLVPSPLIDQIEVLVNFSQGAEMTTSGFWTNLRSLCKAMSRKWRWARAVPKRPPAPRMAAGMTLMGDWVVAIANRSHS